MDFRQYDNALGRFHNMDRLAELAPGITPYRFAFNNPNYWSDPTGLFESWAAAQDFLNRMGRPGVIQAHDGYYSASYFIGDNQYFASMNDGHLGVFMVQQIEAVVITGTRSSSGGGGGGSSGGSGFGG